MAMIFDIIAKDGASPAFRTVGAEAQALSKAMAEADAKMALSSKTTAAEIKTAMLGVTTSEREAAVSAKAMSAEISASMASMAQASKLAAAKTAEADAAIAKGQADLAKKTEEASVARKKSMMNVGLAAALATTAIIGESVKMAADFQQKTSILVTAAGESTKAIGHVRSGILDLAASTGASWKNLADGAYILEKAGYRDADMLQILKAGAQAAAEEGANLATVVGATSAVMHDYHLPVSAAVAVTNELKTGAGEAKATFEEFDKALGRVVPMAANAKISFADISGTLAEMTQHGISAQDAADQLQNAMRNLIGPNQVAQKMMAQLGISVNDVTTRVGDGPGGRGLAGTLQYLSTVVLQHMGPAGLVMLNTFNQSKLAAADAATMYQKLSPEAKKLADEYNNGTASLKDTTKAMKGLTDGPMGALALQYLTTDKNAHGFQQTLRNGTNQSKTYNDMMKTLTGGANGLSVALNTTMGNADGTNESIKRIAESGKNAGKDVNGWATQQKNLNQRLSEAHGEVTKLAIELGNTLLPPLTAVMGAIADHPGAVKALAIGIGVVLVAATVAWTASLVKMGVTALGALGPVGLVIAGVVVAIKLAYDHFKPFHDAWDRGWKQWGEAFSSAADTFQRGWKQITDGLDSAWHGIQGFGRNVVDVFGTIWSALTGGKKAQDDILGFFSRLPGDIGKALGQAGGVLADFGSKIPGWIMSGVSVVGDFGKKLLDRITSGLSTGAHQLADFGSKIPGWIMSGISAAGDLGKKLLDLITSGLSAGWHVLADFGKKIPGWIWDSAKAELALLDPGGKLMIAVTNGLQHASDSVLNAGKKLPGWLLDGIKSTIADVVHFFDNFFAHLFGTGPEGPGKKAGRSLIDSIVGGAVSAGVDLVTFFINFFDHLFDSGGKGSGGAIGQSGKKGGKSLIDSIVDGALSALDDLYKFITGLPDVLAKWAARQDWGKIGSKILNAIVVFFKDAKNVAIIAGAIIGLIVAASVIIILAIPAIMLLIGYALVDALVHAVKKKWHELPDIFDAGWKQISDQTGHGWKQITDATERGWKQVTGASDHGNKQNSDSFSHGWKQITDTTGGGWHNVSGTFERGWHQISGFVNSLWHDVSESFTRGWHQISGFMTQLWHELSGAFERGWHQISGLVTSLWHDVSSSFEHGWHQISGFASSLWHEVAGFFTNLWHDVTGAVNSMADGIRTGWDKIKGYFSEPINWVIRVVYNGGIVPLWNSVAGIVGDNAKLTNLPGFDKGGGLPGYSATDNQLASVRSGEHIWTPEEVTAAGGHHSVAAMRSAVLGNKPVRVMGGDGGYAVGGGVNLFGLGGGGAGFAGLSNLTLPAGASTGAAAAQQFTQQQTALQAAGSAPDNSWIGKLAHDVAHPSNILGDLKQLVAGALTALATPVIHGLESAADGALGKLGMGRLAAEGVHKMGDGFLALFARKDAEYAAQQAASSAAGLLQVGNGTDIVNDARRYLGQQYILGGDPYGPGGTDCSGLVDRVMSDLGHRLPGRPLTYQLVGMGQAINYADALPGDLVFTNYGEGGIPGPGHVGIYEGGGRMIDDPNPSSVVREESVWETPGAVRRLLVDHLPTPTLPNAGGSGLQSIAQMMLNGRGWGNQWDAFNRVVSKESDWDVTIHNGGGHGYIGPNSAYGLPQALPGDKMASAGADWQTNGTTQLRWMMDYISSRWGDPNGAWANEQSAGWYAAGGMPPIGRPVWVGEQGPERVIFGQQAQVLSHRDSMGSRSGALIHNDEMHIHNDVDLDLVLQQAEFRERAGHFG